MAKPLKKPVAKEEFVKPLIRSGDQKHAFEAMFESDKMPTLKSVGYAQLEGTSHFVSYVLTTRGKEVLNIEVSEPNLRSITEDSAKITFIDQFMLQGV